MFAPLLLLRVHTTHVFCCIGEQCHMSRLFKCYTQTALMLGACPCLPAGFDFATIGDVAFQETVSIFVINFAYMIMAKLTNFAARCALASSALTPFAAWGAFRSSLHGLFSSISRFRRGDLLNLQEGRNRLHALLKSLNYYRSAPA